MVQEFVFRGVFPMAKRASSMHTRPSLLLRIRDPQDAEAWQTFVEMYTPLIYGYCRHHGLQEADAADVTQEVLVKVAGAIGTFEYRPERGRFRDWLGTVTRGELVRFVKKMGRGRGAGGDSAGGELDRLESPEQDPVWIDRFHAHVLQTALERIRPQFEDQTWRAFELAWLEDCNALDAARELNQPIEMVYVAKSRVLKRLREEVLALAEDLSPLS
jgi:RNA polymerase sigma-70 factor (ECF subfamily)